MPAFDADSIRRLASAPEKIFAHPSTKPPKVKNLPLLALLLSFGSLTQAASPFPAPSPDTPANRTLQQYWQRRTAQLNAEGSLASVGSAAQWNAGKNESRRQLFEMLGLAPLPSKTPLQPVITGVVKENG